MRLGQHMEPINQLGLEINNLWTVPVG